MNASVAMRAGPTGLEGERLLYLCIGVSVFVHTLAMLYAPKVESPPQPATRLTATLRAAPAPKPAAPEPAAAPEPPVQKAEPPPPPPVTTPAPPTPAPKPIAEKAPAKTLTPPTAPVPVPTPAPSAPAPAPAAPVEARSAAPATEAKDAPRAAASAGDPDEKALIAGYAAQLAQVAGKYKRYPNDAMQNGWEGVALVTLRIGSDGRIMGAPEISTSSGHDLLDAEARTTINKAKPFVQIPAGLKGKEFIAQVRVVFSLKN